MRIWGYVTLAIGILFFVLYVLAQFGGAHLTILPLFVSVFLVAIGWSVAKSGKGLVQSTPAPSDAAAQSAMTMAMPMSPDVAAVIGRQGASSWRLMLYLAGGLAAFFIVMGAIAGVMDKTPGEGGVILAFLAAIGVMSAAMIVGISWLTTGMPLSRDVHGTSYLRTTGPIQVVPIFGGAMLRLADRAFLMKTRTEISELGKLSDGSVDYSPRAHVILAAWDSQGRSVYRAPGYNVERGV